MTVPDKIEPDSALFLDFDGTLADLAPRPDAVQVAPGVVQNLARLQQALGGALAIVSGRPVAELDHHLQPLTLCAAGVHGVERRGVDGQLSRLPVAGLEQASAQIAALVQQHPGLQLEIKPGALALHFRQAPELEPICLAAMQQVLATTEGMALMHGKMVLELKPQRASKGEALRAFLGEPPFHQRRPWFFGDDVTDESAFEVVQSLGGVAVKIGPGPTLALMRLPDPAAMRAWLAAAAEQLADVQPVGASR